MSHCWGHLGIDVTRGTPSLGQIRVSKRWESSSDALECSAGGGSKEPQTHTDYVLRFPAPPRHKAPACRVLGTHTTSLYPPPLQESPPAWSCGCWGGGAGPAKRIYCSTQGALEAITFPPLDLKGFETSKRIGGGRLPSGRPRGLTPQGLGRPRGGCEPSQGQRP